MTATEVFYKFYREALEPNERVAFMLKIRKETRECNNLLLRYYDEFKHKQFDSRILEKQFVERLINGTWYSYDNSSCTCLSSFMKYFIYYFPSIIGTARNKNKYIARIPITDDKGLGYKEYHRRRLIKKWHDFLKENVANYDRHIAYCGETIHYKLKNKE